MKEACSDLKDRCLELGCSETGTVVAISAESDRSCGCAGSSSVVYHKLFSNADNESGLISVVLTQFEFQRDDSSGHSNLFSFGLPVARSALRSGKCAWTLSRNRTAVEFGIQGALTIWSPELPVQARLCDGLVQVWMPTDHHGTRIWIDDTILAKHVFDLIQE